MILVIDSAHDADRTHRVCRVQPENSSVRERDFDRVLTFIDAIVAIAITLLVLPLVDVAGEVGHHSVGQLLRDHANQFWAFLLSFAVIASLWLSQHRLLRPVLASSPALVRVLLVWTLTIVVLPFPTALVAEGDVGEERLTKLLYVGTMTVSSILLAVLAIVVARSQGIRDPYEPVPDAGHAFSMPVMFVVALVLMLVFPALSYWPLLLLALPGRVAVLGGLLPGRGHTSEAAAHDEETHHPRG